MNGDWNHEVIFQLQAQIDLQGDKDMEYSSSAGGVPNESCIAGDQCDMHAPCAGVPQTNRCIASERLSCQYSCMQMLKREVWDIFRILLEHAWSLQMNAHLHVRYTQEEFSVLTLLNPVKDLCHCQGYDAWLICSPSDGVSLATAGLAIGKHCSIEATNDLSNHLLCGVPVDMLCCAALIKDIVQRVGLCCLFSSRGTCIDLVVVHLPGAALLKLCLAERANPDTDTAEERRASEQAPT